MPKKLSSCLICLILLCTLAGAVNARALVGAIRWDDWSDKDDYPYKTWSPYLEPEQWHYRHPFFSKLYLGKLEIRCDNQEATDQEIAYANNAGLDYWAYGYYFPNAWPGADRYNFALYNYLSSEHNNDINFCVRIGAEYTANDWDNEMIPTLVELFKEPTYQTVAGNRPLLYIFGVDEFTNTFGSDAAARQALDDLRTAATNAGCGSPYVACMVWSASDGADHVNSQGYDAISAYTYFDTGAGDQEYPYSTIASENTSFWNSCRNTGKKVIPIINIGWDNRPGRADGYRAPGPWYTEPTMTEWKNHLQAALNWVDANPSAAEPNAVIIYAWNEFEEGGWMTPTRGDGTVRIDATGEVLNQ